LDGTVPPIVAPTCVGQGLSDQNFLDSSEVSYGDVIRSCIYFYGIGQHAVRMACSKNGPEWCVKAVENSIQNVFGQLSQPERFRSHNCRLIVENSFLCRFKTRLETPEEIGSRSESVSDLQIWILWQFAMAKMGNRIEKM
jgi:hypothetical protein